LTPRIPIPRKKLEAFCARWRVEELALFGSVLREDFGADSDVYEMFLFHREARPTLLDMACMQDELEHILGRPVDLVSRRGVESSPNYLRRNAILSSAEVVYGT